MTNRHSPDDYCLEILDQMIEGCQVVGPDWRYLYLNDMAELHARAPKGELLGRRMTDVFPGIETTPMFRRLATCLEEGSPGEMVHEFLYPDGTSAWFQLRFRPVAAGLLILSLDLTERKLAEAELQSSLHRFELLAWTAGELLRSSEPQKVVETLCRRVMQHLDCHAFFNFLVDEQAGRLHLNACAGIPEEEARRIEWLDYGVAVCGCVARDGCRIVAEHIPATPDERTDLVKSYGIRAYACHPLLGQEGQLVGTLSFGTRSRDTFSDDDLSLMKAVADQVAVAMIRLKNKLALRESEERYRHLVEKLQLQNEEIRRRNEELERFNRAVVGREERMIELKREVNALARRLGEPARYPLEFLGGAAEPEREGN